MSLNTGNAILSNGITLDSSYNVGIGGAASGSYKLNVTGAGNFTGALSGTSATFSGNVGIGTATSPAAELQVGKASDVTIALSNSNSVTSGNRGSIAWYNSSVSTVANIKATAVTDNVGTQLEFYTRPAAGSLTQVMTLASTGAATFNLGSGEMRLNRTGTSEYLKANTFYLLTNGNDQYLGSETAGVNIYAGGSPRLNITSGGLVGIGTSSPDLTLTVNGAMNLRNSTRAGAFEIDSSGNLWMGTATTAGNLYFETGHSTSGLPSTGTPRMTITGGGNVGIGVTPSNWDVTQTRTLELGTIGNYISGYVGSSVLYIGTNSYLASDGWKYARSSASSQIDMGGGAFRFLQAGSGTAGNAISWSNAMTITSGGNVNIAGSASTNTRLTVTGADSTGSNYTFVANNTSTNIFLIRNDGLIYTPQTYGNSVATPRTVYIQSDGQIGGISSVRASKTNIQSFDTNWLYELNPVQFNYRKKDDSEEYTEEFDNELFYGLIAEETELVNKEICTYNEDKLIGIEYSKLVPVLLKAVQEQQAQIEAQQQQINSLINR